YTRIEVQQFHDTLIQHMESVKESIDERALHKRGYDSRRAVGQKFEEQNTSNSSRNDVMLMMQISNTYMMKSQWLRYSFQSEERMNQGMDKRKCDILKTKEVVNTYKNNSTNLINLTKLIRKANILGEDSAHFASISLFVPSPEPSPKRKAEEEKEIPFYTKMEQEDVVTEEPKEAKVTKEEPHVTQPEPFQTMERLFRSPMINFRSTLTKNEHMKRAMKEAKLGEPMIKKVLTRAHSEKLKQNVELRKKRFDQYVWTTNNRLKPDRITDTFIHPNTRPVAVTIYINNDPINFEVHRNFKFCGFDISEWDELSVIISKKKNKVGSELMTSLSNKYERLKKIRGEVGPNLALPLPEQDPSLLKHKRKTMKLDPETYIVGLHCRKLPEGVPFKKNLVIEQPEH
nr:hypothetical protein [Tanacetum cinerariifolium]